MAEYKELASRMNDASGFPAWRAFDSYKENGEVVLRLDIPRINDDMWNPKFDFKDTEADFRRALDDQPPFSAPVISFWENHHRDGGEAYFSFTAKDKTAAKSFLDYLDDAGKPALRQCMRQMLLRANIAAVYTVLSAESFEKAILATKGEFDIGEVFSKTAQSQSEARQELRAIANVHPTFDALLSDEKLSDYGRQRVLSVLPALATTPDASKPVNVLGGQSAFIT